MILKHLNTSLRKLSSVLHKPFYRTLSKSPLFLNLPASSTMSVRLQDHILPNDVPIIELQCEDSFNALTDQEKLYTHYLSKACWNGSLISFVQCSPESPVIFILLHKIYLAEPIDELKKKCLDQLSDEEFTAFLVYTTGFLGSTGNYKDFSDSKIIPNLPQEKFHHIVKMSEAYHKEKELMSALWTLCVDDIYSLTVENANLGFPEKGVTTYLSSNCNQDDMTVVNEFLKANNIEAYNCRTFKYVHQGKPLYEIRLASVLEQKDPSFMAPKVSEPANSGAEFKVTRGDYSLILKRVNEYLEKAKEQALNENEKQMLEKYIEHFNSGKLDDHKDGSRFWIKDKGPIIETYIGFIENYRDPAGLRAEWEGFVAMVNKEMSKKFSDLVSSAETFLKYLPWGEQFEKDKFLRPDFTSLDVLTFASSGVPCGINIPNYDEIRQSEGFKNVSLGNVLQIKWKPSDLYFLNADDIEYIQKYATKAYEVQVGFHELLGHGSGKLFRKVKAGNLAKEEKVFKVATDPEHEYNFDVVNVTNPLTNSKIDSFYGEGDNYDSVFTTMGSSYEECRAETVALHLSLYPDALKVFGFEGEEAETIMYVNWLTMCYAGLKALEMYQPNTSKWLQAHSQGRFVILRVLLEAGQDFVRVEETEAGKNLLLTVDKSKIKTVGAKAISDFLLKLQVYKSTGDIKSATAMYDNYSAVLSRQDDPVNPFLTWRDIVMAHKKPRKIFLQANTNLHDNKVSIKTYNASPEGLIQSWLDRFPSSEIHNSLIQCWIKDREHFYSDDKYLKGDDVECLEKYFLSTPVSS
ncbi:hypothetical protein WDU94_012751 [Cyamophila willieti]